MAIISARVSRFCFRIYGFSSGYVIAYFQSTTRVPWSHWHSGSLKSFRKELGQWPGKCSYFHEWTMYGTAIKARHTARWSREISRDFQFLPGYLYPEAMWWQYSEYILSYYPLPWVNCRSALCQHFEKISSRSLSNNWDSFVKHGNGLSISVDCPPFYVLVKVI